MLLAVGRTRVELPSRRSAARGPVHHVDFLVDSGAVYSVLLNPLSREVEPMRLTLAPR
jgi:hypothetical protein